MKKKIRIGTRGSKLALYQANLVLEQLKSTYPDQEFSIEVIQTKGDKILDVALSKIGDKGLFTKEIETALLEFQIDLAVHSLKDLPTIFTPGTKLGAILKRGEFRDALVSRDGLTLNELTEKHKLATSSLRRKAQVHKINPKVQVVDIRGNVDTRLRKMNEGYCDAMIMAGAGLERLGYSQVIRMYLEPDYFIPAPGQGAIAVEIRENDTETAAMLNPLHCHESFLQITAERSFLNELEGGCQVPIGCTANLIGSTISLTGLLAMPDGSVVLKDHITGEMGNADPLGRLLAKKILSNGGNQILSFLREMKDKC